MFYFPLLLWGPPLESYFSYSSQVLEWKAQRDDVVRYHSDDDNDGVNNDEPAAAAASFVLRLGFGILLYANRQTGRQTEWWGKICERLVQNVYEKEKKSFVV